MKSPDTTRLTYQPEHFFKLLGISKMAGYRALHDGQIPSIRIGRKFYIPKNAGDRMLGVEPATVGP